MKIEIPVTDKDWSVVSYKYFPLLTKIRETINKKLYIFNIPNYIGNIDFKIYDTSKSKLIYYSYGRILKMGWCLSFAGIYKTENNNYFVYYYFKSENGKEIGYEMDKCSPSKAYEIYINKHSVFDYFYGHNFQTIGNKQLVSSDIFENDIEKG